VTVLGTKFGVRKTDEDVRVVLVRGSVKVGSGSVSTTLDPGQAIEIDRHGRGTIRRLPAAEALAWAEGRLVFRRTRVADAIKEVNRYARRPIELRHPGLGKEEVSGTFSTGDSDAFAASLVTLFDLQRDDLEQERIVLTK
jgi:ferric-dicitrate binding protein FerR (iron transport regulator)